MRQLGWIAIVVGCHAAKPAAPTQEAALIATIDRQLAARPSDGVLLYQRATLEHGEALRFLERLDATGWDVPLRDKDFGDLAGAAGYRAIADRIAARTALVKRSELAFSVPDQELIPEGIAVDSNTGTFYVGSLRKRLIVAIDGTGASRTIVPERQGGMLGVVGVKVDAARGLLWAASHGSKSMLGERSEADGVYAFALADGSVRRRVLFPSASSKDFAGHLSNDFAIASDGTVYVTDSNGGTVYRVPPDRDELEAVLPPGTFVYPNGLALAGDRKLYVADALGLAAVALDTRAVTPVTPAGPKVALGGIDGMVLDGAQLYAVQNGIGAPRIVAITLDGDRATALTVLENDPAALELPTTTALWRGALYTIANSQLDAFGPDGLRPGRTLADPRILRTPLPAVP